MQPTTMLPKLTDTTQTISFSEGDGVCSAEIYANDVVVTGSGGAHKHGSSKVKLRNLVDYNWEPKPYSGQLLAVHMSGNYLAYSIKALNSVNPGTWTGMVRVVYNPKSGSDVRALIKGIKGEVQDLAFAHIQNQVILACIDEMGNFYVHEIEVTDSGLRCTLIAEVWEDTGALGELHRVVWCPFIPDEEDETPDDDEARLLLTTHGNVARMWNMRSVARAVSAGAAGGEERRAGAAALAAAGEVLLASEHGAPIVDAAFSPDGSALATAAIDGYVMFFQVSVHDHSSPRCLHNWQPHAGKPLSCLFFLDNHKNYNTDVQFWKFAVTGAENNTTIKIWSCKSWNCLQTISLTPGIGSDASSLGLKASLDTSATYLLLSDFKARSLYVLHMIQDADNILAYCKGISEYSLPYPVLGFCIVDAEEDAEVCDAECEEAFGRNGAATSPDQFDLHLHEEEVLSGEESGEGGGGAGVAGKRRARLRLYIVHPKGLQEGELIYSPPPAIDNIPVFPEATFPETSPVVASTGSVGAGGEGGEPTAAAVTSSILQQQSQQLKNLLMRTQTQPGTLIGQRAESPPPLAPQLNLMTPDAFSSPGKREEDDPPLSATPDVTGKPRTSTGGFPCVDVVEENTAVAGAAEVGPVVPEGAEAIAAAGGKFASGGSSPSREVQLIMAHEDEQEEELVHIETEVDDSQTATQNGVESMFPSEEPYVATEDESPPAELSSNNGRACQPCERLGLGDQPEINGDTTWPQISIAQIAEANQRKASSDKSSNQSLSNSLMASIVEREVADEPRVMAGGLTPADRSRLEQLEVKLDKLTELVTAQSRELREMRAQTAAAAGGARDLVEEALRQHSLRTHQTLQTALADGWERIGRLGEAAAQCAATAAGAGAARALEPLASALQVQLAAKLTATDRLLRDNIDKLVTSKTVMEHLSSAVAKALATSVRNAFNETMLDSVVPVMEKAHAQMFRQINNAFQNGTKEFVTNTEAAARAAAERGGAAAASSLKAVLERHAEALAAVAPPPSQQQVAAAVRDAAHSVLEKEMTWWREQARSVAAQMSRAHSPATPASHTPAVDRQMQVSQIQALVSSGDVNAAFQLALSASDLALVVAACRATDPGRASVQLRQHVLLSLVQQLAADMTRDTHLKYRYLEEAIMNLDTTNPVTREHVPVVVRELQKQIMAFMKTYPAHELSRQFKMLLMATDSLLKNAV